MASARPHRPATDPRTALTDCLLLAEQGLLDRDFTEYLLALGFYPVGTVVELTDGRLGVVAAAHSDRRDLRDGFAAARRHLDRRRRYDPAAAGVPRPRRGGFGRDRAGITGRRTPGETRRLVIPIFAAKSGGPASESP